MNEFCHDLQLPPGEATLRCECGFESEPFCFIEHLYRCKNCKSVDRPAKVPFLYLPPKCSRCNLQFDTTDRIPASTMRPGFLHSERFSSPHEFDVTLCPRCGTKTLAVNSLGVHYQCTEIDHRIPKPGDTIHARTMKTNRPDVDLYLWSPRLSSELALSIHIENRDANQIVDGHHEFRVISVNVSAPKLVVEYIRRMPAGEWQWFC